MDEVTCSKCLERTPSTNRGWCRTCIELHQCKKNEAVCAKGNCGNIIPKREWTCEHCDPEQVM